MNTEMEREAVRRMLLKMGYDADMIMEYTQPSGYGYDWHRIRPDQSQTAAQDFRYMMIEPQ